jgi:hypothetical protein
VLFVNVVNLSTVKKGDSISSEVFVRVTVPCDPALVTTRVSYPSASEYVIGTTVLIEFLATERSTSLADGGLLNNVIETYEDENKSESVILYSNASACEPVD